jgi:hypothetical protein
MLQEIADGSDPNILSQMSQLLDKRQANATTRTLLALYTKGYLQLRQGGGLEISAKGIRAIANKTKSGTPR